MNRVLDAANSLYTNVQFTLEEANLKGILLFLDLNMNLSQNKLVNSNWYQKPTDNGSIMS